MIKILHISDIHIGMTNYGKLDKATGLNTRLLDFLNSLDSAVDFAIKERVDLFLFSGDAFKTRDPSPTEQREFAKRIKRVAKADIPVFLLVGNHDLPNALGKANSLEIYKTLEVENVYVSSKPELLTLDLPGDKKIQIGTLPWMSEGQILPDKDDQNDKSTESVHRRIRDKLSSEVRRLAKEAKEGIPTIFTAHTTIAGAEFGGSRKVFIWSTVNLPLNIFNEGPWQYVALGHLHKYQVLNENPPVLYAGSIDRVDFGEEKEDKGFVLVELEEQAKYKFIETPARKFISVREEFYGTEEKPTEQIVKSIKQHDLKESVVKIILRLPQEMDELIDEQEIRRVCSSAYFYAGVEKDYIEKSRDGQFDYLESLTPLELLERYLTSRKTDPKRKERLLRLAKDLVKNQE